MCAQSDGKLGTHRLCLHYIGTLFVTPQKRLSGVLWTATTQGGASRSHASNIAPARLAERVWCAQFQSLLLNICFLSEGFRPRSYILNYFLDGPSGCSHFTSVWLKTYLIFDTPLSRSARRSFPTSQKSRRHNRSCVRTEAPSDMIFVAAPKLSGKMWT